ncbi:hypothetical protein D3C72_1798850 [compost metagenome]
MVALIKTADRRIDPGCWQRRDVIGQTEVQITYQAPGQILCLVAKCIHRTEQRRRSLEDSLTFFGQAKPALAALADAITEAFFQA